MLEVNEKLSQLYAARGDGHDSSSNRRVSVSLWKLAWKGVRGKSSMSAKEEVQVPSGHIFGCLKDHLIC